MKNFILGIIVTVIIGAWITLAVVGVISVKTAILIPVGIVIAFTCKDVMTRILTTNTL